MRPVHIYALVDPRDNAIRYVGKTAVSLPDRLKVHVYQAKNLQRKPTHKEAWIIGLQRKSLKPEIALLETVPAGEDWADRERFWISWGRSKGWKLMNHSDGGDSGFAGGHHSKESKRKLSKAGKGNKGRTGQPWTEEERRNHRKARASSVAVAECNRGEKNPRAKLTEADVLEIRQRAASGEKQKDIAADYPVSYSLIRGIVCRSCWKHI